MARTIAHLMIHTIAVGLVIGLAAVVVSQDEECQAERDLLAQHEIENALTIQALKKLRRAFQ
jgi:hypothetical protein